MAEYNKVNTVETVTIPVKEYIELITSEIQLYYIKRFVNEKTSYNNYIDVTDLRIILGKEKEG